MTLNDHMKPYKDLASKRNRSILIFGDHASSFIPSAYDNLGLFGDDLTRHIAVDIGTATVIKTICAALGCAGHLAAQSRLVLDLNREPEHDGLIPEVSDGTIIKGNQGLSAAERKRRIETYHTPYHQALSDKVAGLINPFIMSVHSFTPKPLTGEAREVDIGLLVKHDRDSANRFAELAARSDHNFDIRVNEPYSAYILNYTVDRHSREGAIPHLNIEIRQDHIDTRVKAREVGLWLAPIIEQVAKAS